MFNKFKHQKVDPNVSDDIVSGNRDLVRLASIGNKYADYQNDQPKPTIISDGAIFDGNLQLDGILHLDGKFKGILKANKVTIGKNGVFDGKLETTSLNVLGQLNGDVVCKELVLSTDSNVSGKIIYAAIRVQPGASVSGKLICKIKP